MSWSRAGDLELGIFMILKTTFQQRMYRFHVRRILETRYRHLHPAFPKNYLLKKSNDRIILKTSYFLRYTIFMYGEGNELAINVTDIFF